MKVPKSVIEIIQQADQKFSEPSAALNYACRKVRELKDIDELVDLLMRNCIKNSLNRVRRKKNQEIKMQQPQAEHDPTKTQTTVGSSVVNEAFAINLDERMQIVPINPKTRKRLEKLYAACRLPAPRKDGGLPLGLDGHLGVVKALLRGKHPNQQMPNQSLAILLGVPTHVVAALKRAVAECS